MTSSPTQKKAPKPKTRKVKAWAAIAQDLYEKDGTIFNLMFNRDYEQFNNAIFTDECFAQRFAERMSKVAPMLVVPVIVTYSLPASPRKKTKKV